MQSHSDSQHELHELRKIFTRVFYRWDSGGVSNLLSQDLQLLLIKLERLQQRANETMKDEASQIT